MDHGAHILGLRPRGLQDKNPQCFLSERCRTWLASMTALKLPNQTERANDSILLSIMGRPNPDPFAWN